MLTRSFLFCYILCGTLSPLIRLEGQSPSAPKHKAGVDAFAVMATVDRRVELMSIVARLAEYGEYVRDDFKMYANDVDAYFGKYRQHPLILLARKIRKSNHIGFDAVMKMAIHLSPPPALTPRVPFTDQVPESRWGKQTAEEFVKLLQQFYKDTDGERFFQSHAALYRTAEQRFQELLTKVDFGWYNRFYGEVPRGTFNLYIGLLNGGGNYGPKVVLPDGAEDLYAIIGTSVVDSAGLPVYKDRNLPIIIHEFNHSFINDLLFAHEQELSSAGQKVFQPVAEKMKDWAYGNWQTTIIESLVRAAVIRYQFEHEAKTETPFQDLMTERNRGFLWIDELFALMGTYENSRSAYPTFRSFFPLVVGYFNDLAKRMDYKAKRFDELSPRAVSLSPFPNGTQHVDPSITEIKIAFDKPLDPAAGYSINSGPAGQAHDPIDRVIGFSDGGATLTVQVKLKPDWDYEFVLTGLGFRTRDGYPLQPYTVKFRTKKL